MMTDEESAEQGSARTRAVLTIAGSDSGGGAGVQADLKAFARCGVHGLSAITAVTAQSTTAVSAIHPLAPEIVLAQVRTVLADIAVDAVKVGMLGSAEVTRAVARVLEELPDGVPVVVDPVMVAESGARLLDRDAEHALVQELVPRATVLTPNLSEARALAGRGPDGAPEAGEADPAALDGDAEAEALLRAVLELGPRIVVLTGGHRAQAVDLFVDSRGGGGIVSIPGERHRDGAAHGSGCTHSAVLAAQLALGREPLQAARIARALTGEAIAHGLRDIGAGAGPVDVVDLARMRARAHAGHLP
jgi:hydroxymethylpyrimidine/phosphomethylpyrimidine kinase